MDKSSDLTALKPEEQFAFLAEKLKKYANLEFCWKLNWPNPRKKNPMEKKCRTQNILVSLAQSFILDVLFFKLAQFFPIL